MKKEYLRKILSGILVGLITSAYVFCLYAEKVILPPDDGVIIINPDPGVDPEPPVEPPIEPPDPPPPQPSPEYEIWVTMPDSGVTNGKSAKNKKISYKYRIISLSIDGRDIVSGSVSMDYKSGNNRGVRSVDLTGELQRLAEHEIASALLIVCYDSKAYSGDPTVSIVYDGEAPPENPGFTILGSIQPPVINIKSARETIQAKISVEGAYSPTDIDKTTVRITRAGEAELSGVYGILDNPEYESAANRNFLIMHFPAADIMDVLVAGDNVAFRIDGAFSDGVPFLCAASCRVIGDGNAGFVESASGGVVEAGGKAVVQIEPDGVNEDVIVIVTPNIAEKEHDYNKTPEGAQSYSNREVAKERQRLKGVGGGARFEPEGLEFSKPAKIKLSYAGEHLDAQEEGLHIFYWNKNKQEWEKLKGSTINTEEKTVEAEVEHFSIYQIMYEKAPSNPQLNADADPQFGLREIYSYPNPAKGGVSPVIRVEVGMADSVSLRFYDVAGVQVHSVTLLEEPKKIGGGYAYEYLWDISGTASGVYICVVTASKSGAADIREIRKLAVIK